VGPFDEEFDACEDVEFNHRVDRAGFRCYFSPKVGVRYHPRSTLRGLFQQMARYGQGRFRLLTKHPETFSLPSLAPAVFLLGVIVGAVAAWFSSAAAVLYLGVIGAYSLGVLVTSLMLAWRTQDVRLLSWLPLVFVTIHAGAGAGLLKEAFAGLRCRLLRRRLPVRRGAFLVPKLCLGTPLPESLFPESVVSRGRETEFPGVRSQTEFGNEVRDELRELPRSIGILNAMTVDVEDYYQVSAFEHFIDRCRWHEFDSRVVASTEKILQALADASVHATFFVLGWVADKHPQLVRAIKAAGHEIGCHSYWHRLVYQQTPQEFRADLRRAQAVLQDVSGAPVLAYRAPSFSITRKSLWALDILIQEGFRFDSSIYPTHHDRYGIAGAPAGPHQIVRAAGRLWEFPMAIFRCAGYPLPIGGGGYFRLYPYALTRHGLTTINGAGRPFVVYLHPWELDPEQPRLKPGRIKAFRHYVNLDRTTGRLKQLLNDFALGTISDVHAEMNAQGWQPPWDLTAAA
jgi:polysaccharide deacetylase family protein (PEP-CTERM system associated)